MEKKYQIFISSTYEDLKEHRLKVRDTILSMLHFPVGMELFSAGDEEQWEIIQDTIDTSDYYVLIVGNRYGLVIESGEDAGISYTEKEFNYARSVKIPIMAFLSDSNVYIKPGEIESPDQQEKLKNFRDIVKTGRMAEWWSSSDDLATKVSVAISKQIMRRPRPGWIRGDSIDVSASLNTIVELTKRVSELEEENRKLQELTANIPSREPSLVLDVNVSGRLVKSENDDTRIEINETDDVLRLQIPLIPIKTHEIEVPKSLDLKDVPVELRNVVGRNDIEEYNEKIPSEAVVKKYNREFRVYKHIQSNGLLADFTIVNDGTAKAQDVVVTIEFPKEFIVLKKFDAENYEMPAQPSMPRNPIKEAERKQRGGIESMVSHMADSYTGSAVISSYDPLSSGRYKIPPDLFSDHTDIYMVSVEKNELYIWRKDLLHSKQWTAGDICIVPTKAGLFEARVTYMCEEYIEPRASKLVIEVVEVEK